MLVAPLLAAAVATAPPPEAPGIEAPPAAVEERTPSRDHGLLGLSLGLGVPSGAGLSVAFEPLSWLRLHAGTGTNGASLGLHGGVTLRPFVWPVAPTLTLAGGRFFEGNATGLVSRTTPLSPFGESLLERIGYDWASAQLGLEVGWTGGLLFYLRGGVGYLASDVHGLEEALEGVREGIRFEASDPTLRAVLPTAEIGLTLFLL